MALSGIFRNSCVVGLIVPCSVVQGLDSAGLISMGKGKIDRQIAWVVGIFPNAVTSSWLSRGQVILRRTD